MMASEQPEPPPLKRPRARKVAICALSAIWLIFGYGAFIGLRALIMVVWSVSHTGLDEDGLLIFFFILSCGILLLCVGVIWAATAFYLYLRRTETKSRNKAQQDEEADAGNAPK
jgi:hypothetical protein